MHPVIPYVLAAMLFGAGVYGVVVRRNAVLVLMAVELMLGAVNLVLVTADATLRLHTGQTLALFVIVIAAAEVGLGLAIVLQLYRLRRTIVTDDVGAEPAAAEGEGVPVGVQNTAAPRLGALLDDSGRVGTREGS